MQSINQVAVTPAFMAALFGTATACVALGVWALIDWDDPFGPYLLAGSALYLVGTIRLTITYHVPRNNALAASSHSKPSRPPLDPLCDRVDQMEPPAGGRALRRGVNPHARASDGVMRRIPSPVQFLDGLGCRSTRESMARIRALLLRRWPTRPSTRSGPTSRSRTRHRGPAPHPEARRVDHARRRVCPEQHYLNARPTHSPTNAGKKRVRSVTVTACG